MKTRRIPTTRTAPRRSRPVAKLVEAVGLFPAKLYTVAPADQLTVDELRNIITGIIPPRTLIKFSRMLTAALEADQERLNALNNVLDGVSTTTDIR